MLLLLGLVLSLVLFVVVQALDPQPANGGVPASHSLSISTL